MILLRTSRPVAKSPRTLRNLLLLYGNNIDGDRIETHALEEIFRLLIDVQEAGLGILCKVEGGHFGDVLIFSLALFFLQFEGDAAYGTALDALHQMGCVAGDLVG